MLHSHPPPAYHDSLASTTPGPPHRAPAIISSLPLHVLYRIVSLTLDPRATPSRFSGDDEEERVRRLWALFRGLKGVDRRFYMVSTSILRSHFLPEYQSHLAPGTSSDPYPLTSHPSLTTSFLDHRSRETAVFDRFIAVHLGFLLRSTESSLFEPSEDIPDLFKRLQPAARIEDLLLTLPRYLVVPDGPAVRRLPLPQSHLVVYLTPGWVSLILRSHPAGRPTTSKVGRDTVIEVRRQPTAEATVERIKDGLEDMQNGLVQWGERVL
ncbi:hypothetical protein DB88DRAFT_493812 [Papiliotrema laurentii]|uniref:Uncharacterized protein n=1 Tax=Papiliotrema laurentii TaxID=5418 RepID=A0AAD9CX12_PAPLA|nr:hypothetical protein DB88DRAFT_493812 [Papiliotrema laurentii]